MLLWILFVVLAILIYVTIIKPHFHWRNRGVIHQTPWPVVGNLGPNFLRLTSMAENIFEIYLKFKNERYFGFYSFLQPVLVLKDVDFIKKITIKEFDSFTDHNLLLTEDVNPLFGKNLFSLRGQRWRNMRSTLSPAFTSSKIKGMYTLMSEVAEQFTDHFTKKASEQSNGKLVTVEMKDILSRYTNDVIASTAFGVQCDSLKHPTNEFYMTGKDATNFTAFRMLKFFGYAVSPFLMNLLKVQIFSATVCEFFRNLVRTTIETREREGIVRPDMMHLLMEAKKGKLQHENSKQEDEGAGFATVEESHVGKQNGKSTELTIDDITAQAFLFFFGGSDSVSGSMCHMANELAINPDIQKKLQEEIDNACEKCNGKISYEAVLKMKYLDMVVCETLRKWPSAIFTDRQVTKPYTIEPVGPNEKPLHLVPGENLWIPIFAFHRDPEFFPDPDKFDPERFSDENKDSIKPNTYLPFGSGPRNCIGSRFALLEIKTVFVHLLKKFDLVVVEKTQIPLRIKRSTLILLAEKGFWLGLQPRNVK